MIVRVSLCLASVFFCVSLAPAQEPLNNESVLKLVKAGFTEDVVVNMINSQPGKYSLGVDEMVALKGAGVSDKVVSAMVTKNTSATGASTTSVATAVPDVGPVKEIGVYYKKNGEWTEVLPEVINWKTGGILKTVATAGIMKGDVNGLIQGASSRNTVRTPMEFLIYTPEGVAITEYQLLRLRGKESSREFRTVTGGVLHVSAGATRDLVPFEGKRIAIRNHLVVLPNLGAGEYGFLPPGAAGSSSASAQLGKMYTFRLIE